MKKTLIFGVNGYLGGLSAIALKNRGETVDGIGTTSRADPMLDNILNDYFQLTPRIPKNELDINKYDSILFCISLDHTASEYDYRNTIDVNCGILAELIGLAKTADTAPRITYLSTMQVFERQNFLDGEVAPVNLYGLTHHICEKMLRLYSKSSIIRLSNVYGPPKTTRANIDWTLIASICKGIVKENKVILRNNGSATRNFLFSEDYQSLLCSLMRQNSQTFAINHFIGPETVSIGRIRKEIDNIVSDAGRCVEFLTPEDYQPETENFTLKHLETDQNHCCDTTFIGTASLRYGIQKTIEHYGGL